MYKTKLKIEGMMCGMCEAHINDAIRKAIPAAKKVSSSHTKGEAVFVTEEAPALEELRKAIAGTGYQILSEETEEYEKKKGLFGIF